MVLLEMSGFVRICLSESVKKDVRISKLVKKDEHFFYFQTSQSDVREIKEMLYRDLIDFYLTTLFILPVIYWRKGRITSSRHDPYGLGYTRVTMVVTKGSNDANRSESLKTITVQIVLCNSRT